MVPRRYQGANVADIFDETQEDLRNERIRRLTIRYGSLGIVVLLLVLAGVGVWQARRWYEARQAAAAAMPYLAAMRDADALPPGPSPVRMHLADAFAKVAASSPEGYRTLARLREAALRSDAGDLKGALAVWDQVADDSSANRTLRDLASLLWAQHQIDHGDPAAITARLQPLEAGANPWRPLAQEAAALLALRQGDKASALHTLHTIVVDPTAPEGLRGRANGLLTLLGDTGTHG
jgi:hypothetical protein